MEQHLSLGNVARLSRLGFIKRTIRPTLRFKCGWFFKSDGTKAINRGLFRSVHGNALLSSEGRFADAFGANLTRRVRVHYCEIAVNN